MLGIEKKILSHFNGFGFRTWAFLISIRSPACGLLDLISLENFLRYRSPKLFVGADLLQKNAAIHPVVKLMKLNQVNSEPVIMWFFTFMSLLRTILPPFFRWLPPIYAPKERLSKHTEANCQNAPNKQFFAASWLRPWRSCLWISPSQKMIQKSKFHSHHFFLKSFTS